MSQDIEEIKLSRGEHGLGFNIKGGVDVPHIQGDVGIYVTKIKTNGSAYADGRIKEGDKVIEVNGTNLERVTHQDAVNCFINAGENVCIKVQHGAELKMKKLAEVPSKNPASSQDKAGGSSCKIVLLLLGIGMVAATSYFIYKRQIR